MSNGDDTSHHDNNKKLKAHLAYTIDLFEETIVVLTIGVKGEPWYIDSGVSKHVTRSAKALNHVKASVEFEKINSTCGNSHPVQGKGDVTFHFLTGEGKKN